MTDESEEIFRRAAKSYPLKTDNADWDAVLKKMQHNDDDSAGNITKSTRKKNYRPFLLLLLLLIPFAVIEYKYDSFSKLFGGMNKKQTSPVKASFNKSTNKELSDESIKANVKKENGSVAISVDQNISSTGKQDKSPVSQVAQAAANPQAHTKNSTVIMDPVKHLAPLSNAENKNKAAKFTGFQKAKKKLSIANSEPENDAEQVANKLSKKIAYVSKQKSKVTIKSEAATGEDAEDNIASSKKPVPTVVEPVETKIVEEDDPIIAKKEVPITTKSIPDTAGPSEKVTTKTSGETVDKDKKKKRLRQKHFYAGLMTGPDFSTVKLQSVKKNRV